MSATWYPIPPPIKKNSLKLPKHLASVTLETPQIKVKASTLINLRDACTARPIQAKELFQKEFTCVPEALFKYGKPYHCVKSKLLQFIEFPSTREDQERYNVASMRGLVVDLSVVIVATGGGGGGDRVPSCRHRAGGVGQFLAGMQFSTKVLKCVVIPGHLLKFLETSSWVLKC